jgi:PAS domain S-box-containing protein
LISARPWWNLRRAWPLLAVLLVSVLLATIWGAVLRRRVRAQTAEIDDQRAFLRQIIDMCPNYIFVKDRSGRFTLVNEALAESAGCKPDELVGRSDTDLIPPEKAEASHRDDLEVIQTRREKIVEGESLTDAAGRNHYLHTVKRPIIDEHGEVTHVLGVANDITLHKEAEASMKRARAAADTANRAKSEFLANMSHEIRTPLNGIIGMSELCLDTELPSGQRECVTTVKLSADSLLSVINDILDFSKLEAEKLQLDEVDLELRPLIEEAMQSATSRAREKGLELQVEVDPDVPEFVRCDAQRLRQVLLSLIGNAIKFTERGRIGLHVQLSRRVGEECLLQFAVADSGIGIAADRQLVIFNPFVQGDSSSTRQYGGTGLGLAICARLVDMMHGSMWLDSELGKGSTFHFTVQVRRASRAQLVPAPPVPGRDATAARGSTLSILLAEDNAVNQLVMSRLLHKRGHRVVIAENGRQVLERVQRERFDAIFMDVQMPEMDGFQATAALRSQEGQEHRTPIIALTAHASAESRAQCLAAGMDDYLSKPIDAGELDALLTRLRASGSALRASA